MFDSKQSKAELSQLLKQYCDEAMKADSSIHTLYAAELPPSRQKYKPKPVPDRFMEEIEKLKMEKEGGQTGGLSKNDESSPEPPASTTGYQGLEEAAREFLRRRR